jgi:hypothetical protein
MVARRVGRTDKGLRTMTLGLKFLFPSLSGASAYVTVDSHSEDDNGDISLTMRQHCRIRSECGDTPRRP